MSPTLNIAARPAACFILAVLAGLVMPRERAFALVPGRALHHYNCFSWTYQNGLPVRNVRALAQTPEGYLWLGTEKGLIRFDGVKFEFAGVPHGPGLRSTTVQFLRPSRAGGLWLGLQGSSFGHWSPGGSWVLHRHPTAGTRWDVKCLLETEQGQLWVGGEQTTQGRVDPLALEDVFPNPETAPFVNSLLRDSRGRVWMGTTDEGLIYWEAGQCKRFSEPSLEMRIVHALAEDQAGRLWLGTQQGVLCYDAGMQRVDMPFPGHEARCILVDRHGVVWVGTTGNGLVRWSEGKLDTLRKADGLSSDDVLALAEDREGSLWIGTQAGLSQLADVKFPALASRDGFGTDSPLSVSASPRGGLWVASGDSVTYWHEGQGLRHSTNEGLFSGWAKRVHEARNGDVFVTFASPHVDVLSEGRLAVRHPTGGMPVALVEDERGMVVSVAGEIHRIARDSFVPYEFAGGIKPELYWVLNLAPSAKGGFWVASANGLFHVRDDTFRRWGLEEGLTDLNVHAVGEDADGTVWVGLCNGISRLKSGRLQTLQVPDGLPDADISALVPDQGDGLWVDSKSRLYRLSKQDVAAVLDGRKARVDCATFDGPDSVMPSDKSGIEASGCRTLDGRIWFPSSRGVVMVDPAAVPTNSIPPTVRIRSLQANGQDLPAARRVVVPPGRRDLEVAYSALTFIAPNRVRFRYRLEGYDPDWVEARDRRLAYYANLKPGHYRFQVTAANADGVWNDQGESLEVVLQPHYHETLLFRLGAGAFVVAVLASAYTRRVRRLQVRQQALQEAQTALEATVSERTASLQAEVAVRLRAQTDLERQKEALEKEIEERKRFELEVERVHRELLHASHQAGQAEVASSVLHNVGNILNSANVSTSLLASGIHDLRLNNLTRAVDLLREHEHDLVPFLSADERGRRLPKYLESLSRHLADKRTALLQEANELVQSIDHLKEVVASQQTYARRAGLLETLDLREILEQALRMQASAFSRHTVKLVRDYQEVPRVPGYLHKVLQILVNLLMNALRACQDGTPVAPEVTVRLYPSSDHRVRIEVIDNGIGIAPETFARLFRHGFTTRKDGHGFGLHSAALAATEMGGSLTAQSEGPGLGARFVLELPMAQAAQGTAKDARPELTDTLAHPALAKDRLPATAATAAV